MRRLAAALVMLCVILASCSPSATSSRPQKPPVLPTGELQGRIRSTYATKGLRVYLESPERVKRGAAWTVRVIIVNEGDADKHFPTRVLLVQTLPSPMLTAGDTAGNGRKPRSLDIEAGGTVRETVTFTPAQTGKLKPGLVQLRCALLLAGPDSERPEVELNVGLVGVQAQ